MTQPTAYVRLMHANPESPGEPQTVLYQRPWTWPVAPQIGMRLTPAPRETGERLVLLVHRVTIDLSTDEIAVLCAPPATAIQQQPAALHDIRFDPEPRAKEFDPAIMAADAERWGEILESCGFLRVSAAS